MDLFHDTKIHVQENTLFFRNDKNVFFERSMKTEIFALFSFFSKKCRLEKLNSKFQGGQYSTSIKSGMF